jgi:hypothetical protein
MTPKASFPKLRPPRQKKVVGVIFLVDFECFLTRVLKSVAKILQKETRVLKKWRVCYKKGFGEGRVPGCRTWAGYPVQVFHPAARLPRSARLPGTCSSPG